MGAVQKGGGLKRTMEGVRGEGALTKQSSSMVEEEEWDGGGFGRGRRVHVTFDEVWIYISSMGLVERIHVPIFILPTMLPKYRVYINKMISLLSKCDWGKEKFKFFNY